MLQGEVEGGNLWVPRVASMFVCRESFACMGNLSNKDGFFGCAAELPGAL
jgi:hypothetical protein